MSEEQFVHFMGLLQRGGKLIQGQDRCLHAIRAGTVRLIALDASASENTKKAVRNVCESHAVRLLELSRPGALGDSIGKPTVKVIGIRDATLAAQAAKKLAAQAAEK